MAEGDEKLRGTEERSASKLFIPLGLSGSLDAHARERDSNGYHRSSGLVRINSEVDLTDIG
jgi:hypothetical protein